MHDASSTCLNKEPAGNINQHRLHHFGRRRTSDEMRDANMRIANKEDQRSKYIIPNTKPFSCATMESHSDRTDEVTIRIRGLGHSLEVRLPPKATIEELQTKIESLTGLAAPYQRIIVKGKNITSNNAPGDNAKNLLQLGLGTGSICKGMLMYTSAYNVDKKTLEEITALNNELDILLRKKLNPDKSDEETVSNEVVREMITSICCKLDAVDVSGSTTLRDMRRKVLHRAEDMDKLLEDSDERGTPR
jgi:hypothetical protein